MLLESFDEMISFPLPNDRNSERKFIDMQLKIREKHATMHGGIREALEFYNVADLDPKLTGLLDKFYYSRVGIRMMVDQHIATQQPTPGYKGIIANECSPTQVAMSVVHDITKQCNEAFGDRAPRFKLTGRKDALFKYIPGHLAIILTEVIKNAVQNTMSQIDPNPELPILIEVAGGKRGVSLKVCDQGGGMHWEDVPQVWSYLRKTTKEKERASYDPVASNLKRRVDDLPFDDPFGMPIARLYARYFGGDLTVMPMEGTGCDTYVHLKRLTDDLKVT